MVPWVEAIDGEHRRPPRLNGLLEGEVIKQPKIRWPEQHTRARSAQSRGIHVTVQGTMGATWCRPLLVPST